MRTLSMLLLSFGACVAGSGCGVRVCRCAPCPADVVIEVTTEAGVFGPVLARGTVCRFVDGEPRCELSLEPGEHDVTVTGGGALPTTVHVSVGPRTIPGACDGQCPACSPAATFEATLHAAPIDSAIDADAGA